MQDKEVLIEIKDLCKSYDDHLVLDHKEVLKYMQIVLNL